MAKAPAAMTKQSRLASLLLTGEGAVHVNCAPPTEHTLGRCDSCSHSPVAYSQAHRNPQRRFALASRTNPAPAHNRWADVQLNREPNVLARLAFPLARHAVRLVAVGRRCPDIATAALGAIHDRYRWLYPTNSTQCDSGNGCQ